MNALKRQKFLESFLGALGARQIVWTNKNELSIAGTVIYDPLQPEERQDFIWHMTEQNVPSDQVIQILKYLTENQLLQGDRLIKQPSNIEIPNLDEKTKEKLFGEIFEIGVNMVDDGEETDCFYIHD